MSRETEYAIEGIKIVLLYSDLKLFLTFESLNRDRNDIQISYSFR